MTIEVTSTLGAVNFAPDSELMEVIQNVKTILSTPAGTVPLDRDFGLTQDYIDAPINQAKALFADDAVKKINKYEPRAVVDEILFSGDAITGNLKPTVRIKLKNG
mgnify:CR=1 FL=1